MVLKILDYSNCSFTSSYYSSSRYFRFLNKLAPNVPNDMLINLPLCSLASFYYKTRLLKRFNYFMISFIIYLKLLILFAFLSLKKCQTNIPGRISDPIMFYAFLRLLLMLLVLILIVLKRF